MTTTHCLFISDLHLCNERPEKLALFRQLLRGPARNADTLYILGDLFESWAGDDDSTPPHPDIVRELTEYSASGGKLAIMRGNRDFLLGPTFIKATGATQLKDPTIINLYGKQVLLSHGDTLCTRDIPYQVFRLLVNNPVVIPIFLALPYSLRYRLWHRIRFVTKRSAYNKSPDITDVHQPAVEKVMHRKQVHILIHGHTHREGIHEFSMDGITARRYVLGDWYDSDSVLVATNASLQLMRVQAYLDSSD